VKVWKAIITTFSRPDGWLQKISQATNYEF
jgi:hypothetical protein